MRSLLFATTVLLPAAAGLAQNPLTNTLLKDLNTGPSPLPLGSSPELLDSAAGRAWFTAFDRVAGRRIWTTDGTTAGTVPLGDLSVDRDNSLFVAGALALPNGRFLVATESTAHGVELFVSDQPGAPLQLLMDFAPGAVVFPGGRVDELPRMGKDQVARRIVSELGMLFAEFDQLAT